MNKNIKIGDRIWHIKYKETKCAKFIEDKKKRSIIVGQNGTFAPADEWIKLSNPLPDRKDEEHAKEIHLE